VERNVSSRELTEWQALYRMNPWGDDWMQASTIAAVSQGVWSKGRIRLDKFVPRQHVARRDPSELEIQMRHWAAQHNAKFKDTKPK
jgi:hypothetical protein